MISYHRLADAELGKILRYLERESLLKRLRFESALKETRGKLVTVPEAGSPSFANCRWMRIGKFNWFIHYRQPQDKSIIIYAIAHGSRRPGYWLRRTKKA